MLRPSSNRDWSSVATETGVRDGWEGKNWREAGLRMWPRRQAGRAVQVWRGQTDGRTVGAAAKLWGGDGKETWLSPTSRLIEPFGKGNSW